MLLIDKVLEYIAGEDKETVSEFLGYSISEKEFNSKQVIDDELNSKAKEMSEYELCDWYNALCEKAKNRSRNEHTLSLIGKLLNELEEYRNMFYHCEADNIVDALDDVMEKIEIAKLEIEVGEDDYGYQ